MEHTAFLRHCLDEAHGHASLGIVAEVSLSTLRTLTDFLCFNALALIVAFDSSEFNGGSTTFVTNLVMMDPLNDDLE
eukprot:2723081-Amphidinium_carterae.1